MNLLCALLVMVGIAATEDVLISTTIGGYQEGNLSAQAGLQIGDKIVRIGGRRIHISSDIVYRIFEAGPRPIDLTVEREGREVRLTGVSFPVRNGRFVPDFACLRLPKTLPNILREGFFRCITMAREIYSALFGMATGRVPVSELSGPVGTTQAISQVARQGIGPLLYFFVFISVNLAVFNLLPFPALDGGRLIFLAIEKLRGRAVRPEVEGLLNVAGFALLMLLVLLVTYRDLLRLLKGGAL